MSVRSTRFLGNLRYYNTRLKGRLCLLLFTNQADTNISRVPFKLFINE